MFFMLKYPAFVSKQNSKREKQIIFLVIPIGEGWHCPAVKKKSVLLRGISSKHNVNSYYLNCF